MENKQTLEDQLFCLQYQFKTLSEYISNNHVERWVYNCIPGNVQEEHLIRYDFACEKANGKKVLDIAGGSGYGTYLLATKGNAEKVISVELDSEAIKFANLQYPSPRIERLKADATAYINDRFFDLIVSFETIEHLDDYASFLKNVHQSLVSGGSLIISTPITKKTSTENINQFHTIEWSFLDFQSQIREYFDIQEVYVQSVILESDLHDPLSRRIWRKLKGQKFQERERKVFERYKNQYDPAEIVSGYQLVYCTKK